MSHDMHERNEVLRQAHRVQFPHLYEQHYTPVTELAAELRSRLKHHEIYAATLRAQIRDLLAPPTLKPNSSFREWEKGIYPNLSTVDDFTG